LSSQNKVLFAAIFCSPWQSVTVPPVEEVTELLTTGRHYFNCTGYVASNDLGW